MFSKTMTTRMKAATVAALMCLSAAGASVPVMMTRTMDVYAVSVGETLPATEGKNVYLGYTADLATSGVKNITLTLKADYTGIFSYGFGIGIAEDAWWMEWNGTKKTWVDTKGGTVEVPGTSVPVKEGEEFTIQIDTSTLKLKYDPKTSQYPAEFQFRNYYSGEDDGTITVVSVEANGKAISEEPTEETKETEAETETETETETKEAETLSEKLGAKDVFEGYWADYAASGIKNVAVTFTADFTGTVNFGMGIGLADKPYWNEYDAKTKGWIDTKDGTIDAQGTTAKVEKGEEYVVVFDTSKQELSYTPKDDKYPGKFQFRNNDVSEKGGSITLTGIEVNTKLKSTIVEDEGSSTEEDEHSLSKKDGSKSANKTTGDKWTFVDNKDGTGTLTATLARQQEFGKSPLTLTQGFDEEYYAKEGITPEEGTDKLNAHKFDYNGFGLNDVGGTQTVESLLVTITSDGHPLKNFMYGGGLNVENASPADTEAAKAAKGVAIDDKSGYWYNDMGQDKIAEYEEAGVEFGITPSYGYYLSAEDNPLGEYFNVYWDVPEEVKQYERNGSISFQYWYGVEDAEEYTELSEVDLAGGVITYTEARTFDYSGVQTKKIGETIKAGKTGTAIEYKDLGLKPWNEVKAMVFTLDAGADLDKLVYGVGTSVGDEFKMFSPEKENWDYVMLNTKKGEVEIVWYVPTGVVPNVEYGNFQFGYWYGGKGETELADVTLKSVDVYYADGVEPTEPPTEAPTEATTEAPTEATTEATEATEATTAELLKPNYGDANVDGDVNILDVIATNKYLVGSRELSPQGLLNADVNDSGDVGSDDALNILKCALNIIKQSALKMKK